MANIDKIRNPFTSADSQTFCDLIRQIETDLELGSRQRREIASALRQVPKWLNRLPAEVPANAAFLNKALQSFHHDHAGITKRRYQNVISQVKSAFSHSGLVLNEQIYQASFTADWLRLWNLLDGEKYYKTALSRFFRFCSAQNIAPHDVTEATFRAFHLALEAEAITKKPRTQHQTACRIWNSCVKTIQGWPQHLVPVPVYGEFYTQKLEAFPVSFQTDLKRYMDRLSHSDPFDTDGPPRALKPRSIQSLTMKIRQIAAALEHQGHALADITSLTYLVENYKEALKWHLDRNDGQISSQIAGFADCLRAIAKYHVRVPADLLKAIEVTRGRLSTTNTGLTEKNKTRLRQFDNPRNVKKLLWLGKTSFDTAIKKDDGHRQNALDASLALALELLIHAPMRIENLASLRLDKHLQWEKAGCKGKLSISIPQSEVKNAQDLHFPLPLPLSNMVRTYLEQFRPRLFKGTNDYLFPSRDGKAKRSDTLSKQISRLTWDRCGLKINPHLFRHFVATKVIEAQPGNYEGARRLLGHKNSNTTYNHYESTEGKSAVNHWHELITDERGHTAPEDSNGLSNTRPMRRSLRPRRKS